MKKLIALIVLVAMVAGGYNYKDEIKDYADQILGNDQKLVLRETPKVLRFFPPQEVEVFTVGKDSAELEFTKTGTTGSDTIAYVTPQTNGEIEDIKIKVGDTVDKNDILVTLGNSFSTEMAEIQYAAAKDGLKLAKNSQKLTKQSGKDSLETAKLGVKLAKESYENTQKGEDNAKTLIGLQIESLELQVESAEDAVDDTDDALDDAEDALEDLEDEYEDLEDVLPANDPILLQMEQAIEALEAQVNALENAKDGAELGLEQLELSLESLEESSSQQLEQLEFAITAAKLQYETAKSQVEAAETGVDMQILGTKGQITQAEAALESAELSLDYQNVRSPIDGVITSITATEGSLTAPGQVLVKVENTSKVAVKTAVNDKESTLISNGDAAEVEINDKVYEGKIVSISPTVNPISKKIDVEIELDDSEGVIPGNFAKVTFLPESPKNYFVPINSIYINEGVKLVKTVSDKNRVICKEVSTGQIIGNYIEIKKGLKKKDLIIKNLTSFIEDGEKVALAN